MDTDNAEKREGEGAVTRGSPQRPPVQASEEQTSKLEFEQERNRFRALILSNPNYFGNIKDSQLKAALNIQFNTTYEEIGCVGYQPQFSRLEAVVFVKQSSGYGGDICSNGSPEYVRFYLSYDDGTTWLDQGMTSFTAYNIPQSVTRRTRLEYAVTLPINPRKRFCYRRNVVLVRAILSWNAPPPPNDPDFAPVWGNVHNTHIQVEPYRRLFPIKDLFDDLQIKAPPELASVLDLTQPVSAAEPEPLSTAELHALYSEKKADVEPHRFALAELHQLMSQPAQSEYLMSSGSQGVLQGLDINLGSLIDKLFPTDGNTSYEELECVGFNPNQDTLVGVIRVKKSNGYSGGPCTAGSREYVTFWADLDNNGTFETCLGTTSVNVHDIAEIPREGLEYAVFLPVNLDEYRQPCQKGARVVRIRAILSWQITPPCSNPNYVPVWGNREETLIHIRPGAQVPPNTHTPFIETVGSMNVADINMGTGLATGPAALAGFTAYQSPFGGEVILTGHLAYPPDISSGATPLRYRVSVSNDGGVTWQRLTNSFSIGRSQLLDGVWSTLPNVTQAVDADNFYQYREDPIYSPGNPQIFVVGNVLARWQTGGLSGIWKIMIEAKDPANPGPVWFSNVITVRLDNTAPVPSIGITSGGGSCADFFIGDVISGNYAVSDQHFGSLSLSILPANGGSFTAPPPLPAGPLMPLSRSFAGGVPTTGEAGNWSLNTAGLPRCGYIVVLNVSDRTIVNSGFVGFTNQAVVGLCLREPGS